MGWIGAGVAMCLGQVDAMYRRVKLSQDTMGEAGGGTNDHKWLLKGTFDQTGDGTKVHHWFMEGRHWWGWRWY